MLRFRIAEFPFEFKDGKKFFVEVGIQRTFKFLCFNITEWQYEVKDGFKTMSEAEQAIINFRAAQPTYHEVK